METKRKGETMARIRNIAKVMDWLSGHMEDGKLYTRDGLYDEMPSFRGLRGGEGYATIKICLDVLERECIVDRVGKEYKLRR